MGGRIHYLTAEEGVQPSALSVDQKTAEKIVKDAMRDFGIARKARVHLVTNADLRARFIHISDDMQALCRFHPDQSDVDIYLTDLARDPVHVLYHEVAHLAFLPLHALIGLMEEAEERLVDYFAFLMMRKRRGGGSRAKK